MVPNIRPRIELSNVFGYLDGLIMASTTFWFDVSSKPETSTGLVHPLPPLLYAHILY